MRKNRPIVPGSYVVPRPLVWKTRETRCAAWNNYAATLPMPLLTERSIVWAPLPAGRLQDLAQGTQFQELALAYLGAFEDALMSLAREEGGDYDAHDMFAFLPPVEHPSLEYVHRTMRARIRIATMLVDEHGRGDDDRYALQLFVDAHLDWLAGVMRYGETGDKFWLDEGHLSSVYPLPNRVRCADELPNLAPLLLQADLLMEAAKSKQTRSAYEDVARILAAKAKPAICHVRHVAGVLKQATQRHALVGDLLLLIVHTVLAGAFPDTPRRASLELRLRLHMSFVGDPIGQRSVGLTIDAFWEWADVHKEALLKLIQEHFIYWCEQEGAIDDIFGERLKWTDFKRAVRYTNGQLRRALDAQLVGDFWRPLQWGDPAIAKIIHDGHKLSLDMCQHNFKGRMGFILAKKFVAVASFLCVVHAVRALDAQFPELRRVLAMLYGEKEGRGSMDDLARAVYGEQEVGMQQLPAPYNVAASGADALLHGYACATKYSKKSYGHELRPYDPRDAASVAVSVGHEPLAQMLGEYRDPFVALTLYVAELSFLPPLRERVRALIPAMELAAWYSVRQATRPDASIRERSVMQLRWLQGFGLTRAQCETISRWAYEYGRLPFPFFVPSM